MAFEPTHVVPQGGLPAWTTPDGSQPPAAQLAPGTELQTLDNQGQWAQVEGSNGWIGWVDANRLVARATVPAAPAPPPGVPAPPAAAPPPSPQPGLTPTLGQPRGVGMGILLAIVTLGIYSYFWTYKTHDEIKNWSGYGVGGGIGLLIYFLAGVATPFIVAAEVKKLYELDGRASPVSGATGAWVFPGIFILVGPFIWFAKVQGALNDYWVSKGAQPA